jgi:hypothetical protein
LLCTYKQNLQANGIHTQVNYNQKQADGTHPQANVLRMVLVSIRRKNNKRMASIRRLFIGSDSFHSLISRDTVGGRLPFSHICIELGIHIHVAQSQRDNSFLIIIIIN